jgi:hypothetical protein
MGQVLTHAGPPQSYTTTAAARHPGARASLSGRVYSGCDCGIQRSADSTTSGQDCVVGRRPTASRLVPPTGQTAPGSLANAMPLLTAPTAGR